MKSIRYALLAMLLVPATALAQPDPSADSVNVVFNGTIYPGYGAGFGQKFTEGASISGDYILANTDGDTGDPSMACDPLTEDNAAEMAGNIALISRGACAFVIKVQNAVAAGATAAVIFNNDPKRNDIGPDNFFAMGGSCTPDGAPPEGGCSIPAAMVSFNSGLAFLDEIKFGASGQIDPIRVFAPVPEPTAGDLASGVVSLGVYDSGYFGDAPSSGEVLGFTFGDDGAATLFGGSVLVGQGGVAQQDYSPAGRPEYTTVSPVTPISDVPMPFTSGVTYTVESSLGVQIEVNTYARTGDPFVVVELAHTNVSGTALTGVYTGVAADWDVGSFADNEGAYDPDTRLLFAFDSSGVSTNYYGIQSLDLPPSGWTLQYAFADLFTQMTNPGEAVEEATDVRAAIAVGPIDFPVGGTAAARFAFVAGENEETIKANAAEAISLVSPANEETTLAGTYRLESAYPNPFADATTIEFAIPTTEEVSVAVYDLLGRQVAVLAEGLYQAGSHRVLFDATDLPSGMYVYRLEAGSVSLTERATIVR